MLVAIPPEEWIPFGTRPLSEFVKHLLTLAKKVDLTRHHKHRRGLKKPAPEKAKYHNGGHASTAKLLALRKTKT